jgi:uncharacterized protein YjbI with pentapeptide repeats
MNPKGRIVVIPQFQELLIWPFLPWLILLIIAIGWVLNQVETRVPDDPLERFKKTLNIAHWPHIVVLAPILAWLTLFCLLFFGLCTVIADIVWNVTQPQDGKAQGDFRFLLTKTAALTAVLGAMVALPFTIYRLKLTTEQNEEIRKQSLHNSDVLYNQKLRDAQIDLYARYQKTKKLKDRSYIDVWADDVLLRNSAIDRLNERAVERPQMAKRIARILCHYLKEMTREYPPQQPPEDKDELKAWTQSLSVKRTDMENAAQVLGGLAKATGIPSTDLNIDLAGANLQAMNLSRCNFSNAQLKNCALDGANFELSNFTNANFSQATCVGSNFHRAELLRASMKSTTLQYAILEQTELQYTQLQGANLSRAFLNAALFYWTAVDKNTSFENSYAYGAGIFATDLSEAQGVKHLISDAFGSPIVSLPDDIELPEHWPTGRMSESQLIEEWRDFQMRGIDNYIPPQRR